MNIASLLGDAAARWRDQPAIRRGAEQLSYGEWDGRTAALADALATRGVRAGDRVAILQHNGPELLVSLFAALKLGAVAVPVNARLHHDEYAFIIDHADARAVLFGAAFASGLEATGAVAGRVAVAVDPEPPAWAASLDDLVAEGDRARPDAERGDDDPCWLFYTSGTTGRPKGATITNANLRFMTDQYPLEVRDVRPGEVCLHVAALTHASGLWALPLTAAGAVHLLPEGTSFDPPSVLRLVERERPAQIVFLAPTMLTMLLDAPNVDAVDLSSLRLVGYGGSPAYTSELRRAVRRLGPVLCQIYGQGECPMTITMLSPHDHRVDRGPAEGGDVLQSAGRARAGIDVAVWDERGEECPPGVEGEVVVRGPVVMAGYWNNHEADAEAFDRGWYRTGDIGRLDLDGYLYLLDRVKDLIITGGSNVYGREVEDVLLTHPGVREVAVVGMPDQTWGEVVTAVVVPSGAEPPEPDELVALCRNHLAGYKKPRRFEFVDELPKNGYGKVLKRELRARLTG